MMGVAGAPDLEAILRGARVPVKLSCLVTGANARELPGYLDRCRALGIRRVVLRKPFGERRRWEAWCDLSCLEGMRERRVYCGNPVYADEALEVTVWDFERTESRAINLFSSGEISREYLLARGEEQERRARARAKSEEL
jgi:hypothetical protein